MGGSNMIKEIEFAAAEYLRFMIVSVRHNAQ